MKILMKDNELELIAETELEKAALVILHTKSEIRIKDGHSTDAGWPLDPHKTNVVLYWPDSKDSWGR